MKSVKVLLVSDIESKYIWDYFDRERFKDIELIISCGDLKESYLEFLTTMIRAPLFYVPGNHDKNYLKNPPGGCVNIDNSVVTFKGIKFLGVGGSHKYNDGPFQYTQKGMIKRIKRLKFKLWKNKGFDILVTHSPGRWLGDGDDLCHQGFVVFNELIEKYNPKFFFHGHQHLNYGNNKRIISYGETTIINAYNYFIIDI